MASGFYETVVLVPEDEAAQFKAAIKFTLGLRLATYKRVPDKIRWHIHHQLMKCRADQICPEADFVLHDDSDCIFKNPVTPEDYFVGGKPVLLMEAYTRMKNVPWQKVTEDILKHPVTYEFMRRHPQVNPIGVYADVRSRVESLHRMPFDHFILSRKPDYVWGVSEHNLLGAFAFYDSFWRNRYHWIDLAKEKAPEPKLIQFWSHSPPDKPQDTPNGMRCVPLDIINSILGPEPTAAPPKVMASHYPLNREVFGYWLNDAGLLGDGVEVGCAYGHNASTILGQWKGKRLFMVDPWERQPAEVYREKTDDVPYDVWHSDCCKLAERDPRAIITRKYSVDAAKEFKDGSLDWVFVDGNHSYAAVLADLDAWWTKVKSGGMFAGHDFYDDREQPHFCEVQSAVTRWMTEHKQPFTVTPCTSWWSRKP